MVRALRQRRIILSISIILITIALLMLSVLRVRAATFPLLVNTIVDETTINGSCSLREAILVVNSGVGTADCPVVGVPDLVNDDFAIRFDTGGTLGNTPILELNSALPAITSTLDIRGFNVVQNPAHRVTITPAPATVIATGLGFEQHAVTVGVNANDSIILGLIIDGFGTGIQVNDVGGVEIGRNGAGLRNYIINNTYGIDVLGDDADGTVISNNSIGIDAANNPAGNTLDGVRIRSLALNTLIGGTNPNQGNVISSNGRFGVNATDVDTIDITNNVIGLLSTASTTNLGNGSVGIEILRTIKATIEQNTIGFNTQGGIRVTDSPTSLLVFNSVGVLPSTTTNVGNGGIGIRIVSSSGSTIRGGAGANQETVVAYSGSTGISIETSQTVAIDDTLTFSNGGLGIDLGNNGVTPNDAGDGDAGPNGNQNYPVFALAATDGLVTGTTLVINGQFPSGAGTYNMVFYVNTTCDPSGFGEGQAFLQNGGTPYVQSTSSGQFSATLTGSYNVGDFITAIAVSQNAGTIGNTSEFAQCIEITDNVLTASFVPSATTIVAGQSVFFDNTSTGLITATRWFIDGIQVSTAYDLLRIFATPGSYVVELEVENNIGTIVRSAPTTITVLAPTATPINTPIPTVNTPIPPVSTETFTPTTTLSPTASATASQTSTVTSSPTATVTASQTATVTSSPTATVTASQTSTVTSSPTATVTASQTSTVTSSPTASSTASATVTSSATASVTASPSATVTGTMTTTVTTTPALEVTVIGNGANSMSINVVNSGQSDANNLLVQEQLRTGVEYRSASLGAPICTEVGGLVSCRLGILGAGQSTNVDITVQTNGEAPDSGVTIVSADGVVPRIIDEPYIIKIGNPPVAPPGSEITYTIRVINPTSETAFDMLIEDNMPDIIEILDASATTGDLEIDGQAISLSLDELAPGERVTLTINARVSDEDEAVSAIINEACVTSSSNPAPNCAIMSFLAVDILPNTGQASWLMLIIRWGIVLGMSSVMLAGIAILYLKLHRKV